MEIEELKEQAKQGNVAAQVDLAHAYLNGNGIAKNRKHYLTWLKKAAESGHLESQMELIDILSNKRGKYADPKQALQWMKIAQKNGATFTQDKLASVGDPDTCSELIQQYLFDESKRNFKQAKELLLRCDIDKDILMSWAKEYHSHHIQEKKEQSNISYLYKLACKADADEMNHLAVKLLEANEKENLCLAFGLFGEAFRLGNEYAAASYFYCLCYGKGSRKNLELATEVYYQCKERGTSLTHRYATESSKGKAFSEPTSVEWKKLCAKYQTKSIANSVGTKIGNASAAFLKSILHLPLDYWDEQSRMARKEEEEALYNLAVQGKIADTDGCRDEGCTEGLVGIGFLLFFFVFLLSVIGAVICSFVTGHVPNWLTNTVLVSLFLPSVNVHYGIKKPVTGSITISCLLGVVGYIIYNIFTFSGWTEFLDNQTVSSLIWSLLGVGYLIFVIILAFGISTLFPMGVWWHYLMGIEHKKGTWSAIGYVIISLLLIMGIGWLLINYGFLF